MAYSFFTRPQLYNAAGSGQSSYLVTASVPVPEARSLLFDNSWRRDGEFPRGHWPERGIDGDYAAIPNLSGLPDNEWQAVVSGVEPLSKAGEFSSDDKSQAMAKAICGSTTFLVLCCRDD